MQIQTKIPVFDDFSKFFSQADSLSSVAEIHGVLCGLICTGHKLNGQFWLNIALNLFAAKANLSTGHRQKVIELYDTSYRQLNGLSAEFEILLPNDEQPLTQRAIALSQWCQGFLYALKLGDSDEAVNEETSTEVQTALRCMHEIARLNFSDIDITDMDQVAYNGIVEYIRSATEMIYDELVDLHRNLETELPYQEKSLH